MRQLLLSSAAIFLIGSAAHAESVTVYTAAPGQAALAIGKFQSDIAGSKPLDLTVGIGSAAFRDPRGATDTFYTLADRGSNFTCDEAKGILGLTAEAACPAGEGVKAGAGRIYPTPDYVISIYEVKLDPAAKTFTVARTIPLTTPKGGKVTGVTNPLTVASTEKPRDGSGKVIAQNANSIDSEGLVRLADGRFFVDGRERPEHRRDFAGRGDPGPLRAGGDGEGFRHRRLSRRGQPAGDSG